MRRKNIKIATRQSPLALCQANFFRQQLLNLYPSLTISLLPLTTSGDKFLEKELSTLGGKGLFVKELEEALLDGRADFAVHSMKDVPPILPKELEIAVISTRTEPRDAFVSKHYLNLIELPHSASVGTSSLRRQSQLKATRPDLRIIPLRGNVETRLNKLIQGDFDAIILAAVGLQRLELQQHITRYFAIDQLIPAAGQGALGLECRQDNIALKNLLQVMADPITTACVTAERSVAAELGGNCQVPLGAFCELDDNAQLSLRAVVGTPQGEIIIYGQHKGILEQPLELGKKVASSLLSQGADLILGSLHEP